ncbi:MAG: pilus assembly protein [Alphaproteobacteria bacterium]|nr:pilus assembly protein [Alphaproteobacteria bacterium]
MKTDLLERHRTARRLRGFASDRRGATALEFGIIATPFFLLMFAIIEVALVFFNSVTLENGMSETSRLIRTGQVQSQGMSENQFRAQLCALIDPLLSCTGNLTIDVRTFDNFGEADHSDPMDQNGNLIIVPQFDPGDAGDVVMVRVFYTYKILTPMMSPLLANMNGGNRLLASTAVFRNEPFGSILDSE